MSIRTYMLTKWNLLAGVTTASETVGGRGDRAAEVRRDIFAGSRCCRPAGRAPSFAEQPSSWTSEEARGVSPA